jgi:hypothetical protein
LLDIVRFQHYRAVALSPIPTKYTILFLPDFARRAKSGRKRMVEYLAAAGESAHDAALHPIGGCTILL